MTMKANRTRKDGYTKSARDAERVAAEARRSTIPQRHTPPASGPNDRRRADPTEPAHSA